MSNLDNPYGLHPLTTQHGGPPHVQKMQKDAAQATAIFKQDVVAREADSFLAPGGTPGTTLYDGVSLDYGAALTLTDHLVVVDPSCIFDAQADGSLVQADEGLNVNFIFGTGNSTTKFSGHELDSSTEATTGTLDAHILRILPIQNNDPGANCRFEILINRHRRSPLSAGV
ncbi:MAG TPA: hypothetical protein VF747_17030 [Blastocatellia bacterium]|jgi:hypothetical protein